MSKPTGKLAFAYRTIAALEAQVVQLKGELDPVTGVSFSTWMSEHGQAALKHELGVEDLMEGAFYAGAKSNALTAHTMVSVMQAFHATGPSQHLVGTSNWCEAIAQELNK